MKKVYKIVVVILMIFGWHSYLNDFSTFQAESILNIVLFLAFFSLLSKYENIEKKAKKYGFIYGIFLSIILFEGKVIYTTDGIIPQIEGKLLQAVLESVGLLLLSCITIGVLIDFICNKEELASKREKGGFLRWLNKPTSYFAVLVSILVMWLPAYLAFYPGITAYDVGRQLIEIQNGNITSTQSVIHTLFIKSLLMLENSTGVPYIIPYTVVQCILMAAIFAWLICYLGKRKVRVSIVLFAWLFFAVNPAVILMVMAPTKDVFFAGMYLIFFVSIYEYMYSREDKINVKRILVVMLVTLLMLLLRKNAIFSVILLLVMLPIVKKNKKSYILSAVLAGTLILLFVIEGPIYKLNDIKPGPKKELLSIPIQQISRIVVHRQEKMSANLLNRVNTYLPYR